MMRKFPLLALAVLSLISTSTIFAQNSAPVAPKARVYRGAPTLGSSNASPIAAVAQFLRDHGANAATASSITSAGQFRSSNGLVHLRLQQNVSGLRVANTYAKAAVNSQGELVSLIENFATISGSLKPASASEAQALRAALATLHPNTNQSLSVASRQGNTAAFTKTAFFHTAPTVERVAIANNDGSLQAGFLVKTWSEKTNQLHYTLVSGAGQIVSVESRTNDETGNYKVFTKDPTATPQTVVPGADAGWLFSGAQNSINIAGNNVNAYLDARNNDAPDRGGRAITDGNFITDANLTQTPSTDSNREVAVQNLFYLNNRIHDTLKANGFTEGAGNFQETNSTGEGLGSDSVDAEAQDGGGTDNANFATPTDGSNPRMQMYLWTGKGAYQVALTAPTSTIYRAAGAAFGAKLNATGISGSIVVVNDGAGTTSDGCEAIPNVSGKVALIDRGTCAFAVKVANAQGGGAVAAIIANNQGDSLISMGGSGDPTIDNGIRIGSVLIGQTDGAALRQLSAPAGAVRLTNPAPLQRDGDLDSDIVFHEYGHGLTWRMIGGMSGPMAGSIGEGMSDVLAIVLNDNDVVGEYAFDDPRGIRRAPYTNFPFTYSSLQGTPEVHNGGEVYAAIGWQLYTNYKNAKGKLTKSDLLSDLLDGMNFTPATPTFEQMRDGILTSSQANHPERVCLVWNAFAKYGVGEGAAAVVTSTNKGSTVSITQSFALPAECQ
jgi:extracellular elastinolytic metalloproteinase